MNRNIKFAILAVLAAMVGLPFALLAVVTSFNIGAAVAQQKPDTAPRWSAAAPGRIEPRTGEYRVGAVTLGRISEVRVKAGDKVAAGDVLVKLDDAEIAARLSAAQADVALKKFTRDDQGPTAKLKRRYDADDAVFDAEQRQVAARAALDAAQDKPAENAGDIEKAKSELAAADAALPKLRATAKEVKDEAGAPKPNQYETALIAAQSQVAVVRALLDQTRIRAPIAGTVLQVAAKVGDTASPSTPDALVVIGDLSSLRVRTEIDARDVAGIKSGQKVTIRSDAFRDQEFAGHVVSIARGLTASRLSPRGPRRPGDTEILEAFVEFDGEVPLRSGMRVDVYFAADEAAAKQ